MGPCHGLVYFPVQGALLADMLTHPVCNTTKVLELEMENIPPHTHLTAG